MLGLLDALDGRQGGLVAAGAHIDIDQVGADLGGVLRIGELVEEVLEDGDGLAEGVVGRLVDAEGVVVGGLLLDGAVGIGHGGLLEGHARLVLVAQLEVGQAHVEVGVLRQGIVHQRGLAQGGGRLGIGAVVATGQAQHVGGITAHAVRAVAVGLEGGHRPLPVGGVVAHSTHDALHLGGMGFAGPGGEVVLRHDFGLVILLLAQVDFGDIIRHEGLVLLVALQAEEGGQGFVQAALGVADVAYIIGAVGLVARRGGAEGLEPHGSLGEVARLQAGDGHAIGHVGALLRVQPVRTDAVEGVEGGGIVLVKETGRGDEGLHAVGVGRVRMPVEEVAQDVGRTGVAQFVGGAGQHIFGLGAPGQAGGGAWLVAGLAQVGLQGREGGGIGPLREQGLCLAVKVSRSGRLVQALCGDSPGGGAAQGRQAQYAGKGFLLHCQLWD